MRRVLLLLLIVASCKKPSVEASPSPSASPSPGTSTSTSTRDAGPGIPYLNDIPKQFAKEHSCPDDRVTVTLRADIDVMQFHKRKAKPLTDDIKADPGRYAKWKSDDDADEASHRDSYSDHHIFEVSGCNITELQECEEWYGTTGRGNARMPGRAVCKVIKLPDAGAK